MDINILNDLFKIWNGNSPASVTALPLSGSDRRYFRLKCKDCSVLGVYNPDEKENQAYIDITKHFKEFEIPVPNVISVSKDKLYYLVEDLGDDTLYKHVLACKGELTEEVKSLFKKSLKYLIKMQVSAGQTFDYAQCYPVKKFDSQAIQWDLNYFKYNFLKLSGVHFDECLLEKDFETLKKFLLEIPMGFFMFRDFQSRNIIIKNNEPWFIDFQSGREGPKSYDVASLLYQAKAQIPYETRVELFDYYYNELSKVLTINYDKLLSNFKGFAVLRTLQVLGAYGFRGYFEKKPHFIESIPYAIRNLKFLLLEHNFPIALPHLKSITEKLIEPTIKTTNNNQLTIRVNSFSYRKGIPSDPSDNGGGFVFDCRGILNPGRFDQYKSLTGKDADVIKFFKEKTNINEFLENTIKVCQPTIDNYTERNFNHLMISFGCTGGQHRSVYCAENFAQYLLKKYDIHVVLWHREQDELIEYGERV